MQGRMVFAVVAALGLPMAAFIAVLEAASEPVVVREVVVARAAAPGGTAATLTRPQLAALPDAMREALEAAARDGAATRMRVDQGTEALLLQLAHAPLGTSRLLVAIGGALIEVELHHWTQESAIRTHARDAYRWMSEKADALARRVLDA